MSTQFTSHAAGAQPLFSRLFVLTVLLALAPSCAQENVFGDTDLPAQGNDDDATATSTDDDDATSSSDDDDNDDATLTDDDDSTLTGDDDDATVTDDDDSTTTDTGTDDDDATTGEFAFGPNCPAPVAGDETTLRAGATTDGRTILPEGRAIKPAGTTVKTGVWSNGATLSPDGKFYLTADSGDAPHSITVISTATWQVVHTEPMPAVFVGLTFDKQGRLWAAGGQAEKVFRFTFDAAGKLTLDRAFDIAGFPTWVAFSPDESRAYVTLNLSKLVSVRKIDDDSFSLVAAISVGDYPYTVALDAAGSFAYVSNWGVGETQALARKNTVKVIDTATNQLVGKPIVVGKNPSHILGSRDASKLYVVSGDDDRIDIIDTATRTSSGFIDLDASPRYSVAPTFVAESPDGATLYVASAARNAIEVVDLAAKRVTGSIPTAWYPVSVHVSEDGSTLYWATMKGIGSGPNAGGEYIGRQMVGVAGKVAVPTAEALPAFTCTVEQNLQRRKEWGTLEGLPEKLFPTAPSTPSAIKHVIFIVKENQTYDSYFGDLEFGEGDPSLCLFPEAVSPNHHALARRFVNLDNFYTESEISSQGHLWTTTMANNDYHEKAWPAGYRDSARFPATGAEAASMPRSGTIFGHILDNERTYRNYGEITGTGENTDRFFPHSSLEYGFYSLEKSDVVKAEIVAREIGEGKLNDFTYISLPQDHTYGRGGNRPTPEWMVSTNDYALGLIVEAVTKSPFWQDTVIFVTEDDPQYAADHIDAHRTIGLVISPWTKRAYNSSVHYSFMSMFRTTWTFLNIPPMTAFDANATPFFDVWADDPDNSEPYTAIKPDGWTDTPVLNGARATFPEEVNEAEFEFPDMTPYVGQDIWRWRELDGAVRTSPLDEMKRVILDEDD